MQDKPFVIPIFIPHRGCPNRCVFCDQKAITGGSPYPDEADMRTRVKQFARYNRHHRKPVQLSFYGGNFLGLPEKDISRLLTFAENFVGEGLIDSIRFSTRPDTISEDRLMFLKNFSVKTIELGIQSLDDTVLSLSRRGHTAAQSKEALCLIKQHHFQTGAQMMTGLPGDRGAQSLETAEELTSLTLDFVRIYPTVVIAGSPLAELYKDGEYTPATLDDTIKLTAAIHRIFSKNNIPVIRMGLQPSESLNSPETVLAGPYHAAFGHLVLSELMLEEAVAAINSRDAPLPEALTLKIHPCNTSIIRGMRNSNIKRLKNMFHAHTVHIVEDRTVSKEEVVCAS